MAFPISSNQFVGKHLLLVRGARNEDYQGFMYTVARQAGIILSVADKPGHWSEDAAKRGLLHSFHPINLDLPSEELAGKLVQLVSDSNIDFSGIITFFDAYLMSVAEAAQKLNMPTNGPEAYKITRDKQAVRMKCNSSVHSFRIKSVADLPQAAETIGFPAVLKPVNGTDSLAVHLVSSFGDLEKVYQDISAKLPKIEKCLVSTSDLLLEQYISGSEHKIDLIIQNGKTLFASVNDCQSSRLPWFQESDNSYPSNLGYDKQDKLIEYAKHVCKMLEMDSGVMHLEVKFSDNTPQLVELNARMGCAYVWHAVKTAWGVDLLLHAYKIALGVQMSPPNRGSLDIRNKPPEAYVVFKYLNAPFTGYVQNIYYLEPFKKDTRVPFVNYMVEVGQKVFGPEDDRPTCLALVLFTGSESREDTERYTKMKLRDLHLSQILSKQPPGK